MTLKSILKIGAPLLLALSLPAVAQVTVPPGGFFSVPPGAALSLACTALTVQGDMSVGSGQVSQISSVGIASGGTLDGGSGTISLSGDWSNAGTFVPGSSTVVLTDGCSSTSSILTGATVFNNLTLSSTTGHTFVIPAGSNITVTGTLTLLGASGQPIQLVSSSSQEAVISLGPQAHVVSTNSTVAPNVRIGNQAGNAIPTLSEWAQMALATLLVAVALVRRRRFPTQA